MNRQLSALTDDEWAAMDDDWDGMDWDADAPTVPTQEQYDAAQEMYDAALARLRSMKQEPIGNDPTPAFIDALEFAHPLKPTAEQFQQALARLATMRQTMIDGDGEFTDLYVDLCEGTVSLVSESNYIVLSPEMLRQAAEWVAQQ